ncbi:hypothetical protein VaNZ11_015596, partial [Volvox africanus]
MDQIKAALVELRNSSCQQEPTLFLEAWLFVKQLFDEFASSPEHGTVGLELLLAETDTSVLISLKEAKRNHATSGAGAATTAGSARAKVLKYLESQLQQREEWKGALGLGPGAGAAGVGTAGSASPAARLAVEIFELQREEDKYAPARQAALSTLSTLLVLEADAPGTPMDAVLREMLARAGELQAALRHEKRAAGVRSELLRLIAVMVDRVHRAATKAATAEAGTGTGPSAPLVEAAFADLGTATAEALAQQALQILDGKPKPKEVAGALSALERVLPWAKSQEIRSANGARAFAHAMPLLRALAAQPRAPNYEPYLAALRLVCRPGACPVGRVLDECGELLGLLRAILMHNNRDVRREAEEGAARLLNTVSEQLCAQAGDPAARGKLKVLVGQLLSLADSALVDLSTGSGSGGGATATATPVTAATAAVG